MISIISSKFGESVGNRGTPDLGFSVPEPQGLGPPEPHVPSWLGSYIGMNAILWMPLVSLANIFLPRKGLVLADCFETKSSTRIISNRSRNSEGPSSPASQPAIAPLHQYDFVFGDLNAPNVIILRKDDGSCLLTLPYMGRSEKHSHPLICILTLNISSGISTQSEWAELRRSVACSCWMN